MDYRTLQTEILGGQQASACAPFVHTNIMPKIGAAEAATKDQAIADILNAVPDTIIADAITVEALFDALYQTGDYALLKAAQLGGDVDAAVAFAMINDAQTLGGGRVHLNAQTTTGQFSKVMGKGLITPAGMAAIQAKAVTETTRMKKLFGADVTAADVSRAVRGPWGDEG